MVVEFDIPTVLVELNSANPESLVFGTDLPSTRAKRPYRHSDCELVIESLGEKNGQSVLYENAIHLYRPMNVS